MFAPSSPAPQAAGTVRVVGVGLTVADHLMTVPRLPGPDRKTTATSLHRQVGGPVPTALAQLTKLGGPAGRLLSAWGDDAEGAAIEANLAAAGLGFEEAACRSAPQTGVAHVWVEADSGRRSLAALRPDGGGLTPGAAAAFARGADLLHTDGWPGEAAVAAAEAVRAGGGTVVVDLGASRKPPALPALADVLNLPAQALRKLDLPSEAGSHPASAAAALLERGPRLVTVTNGSRGCWWTARSDGGVESGFVPAFPAEAEDTCGAGDAFCGGLLFAVCEDFAPAAAVRFASAVASLKVRRFGNREALPGRAAVEALLSSAEPVHEKTPAGS